MTVVGFTGTRTGMTRPQAHTVERLLLEHAARTVHHGDCIGADEQLHQAASALGLAVVVHPPENTVLRAYCEGEQVTEPRPYLHRNADIVDSVDLLLAAPKESQEPPPGRGQGTWSCVRAARRAQVPVVVVWPDGGISDQR